MANDKKHHKKDGKAGELNGLRELFVVELQVLFDAELQVIKTLPAVAKKVTSDALRSGINDHLEETRAHAERLMRVFEVLNVKKRKVQNEAIRGLISDALWIVKNIETPEALDAAVAVAVRCIEHYEIAAYGSVVGWARVLREDKIAGLLEETLDEEAGADEFLSDIAEAKVDDAALGGDNGEDREEDGDENEEETPEEQEEED